MLRAIHKELFQDVLPYKWVGEYRVVNLFKNEYILNEATMNYGNWETIPEYLTYDFEQEKETRYNIPFMEGDIRKLSKFVSGIWQTHSFREGNTKTISTFLLNI